MIIPTLRVGMPAQALPRHANPPPGAVKHWVPTRSVKASKLRKPRCAVNAKTAIDGAPSPSLASANPKARLGLGAPRIIMLMALTRSVGTIKSPILASMRWTCLLEGVAILRLGNIIPHMGNNR